MMFKITDRKGFQITFENGWTVSVQFGYGNYCDNRDTGSFGTDAEPSRNAEIAAWDKDGCWHNFGDDTVEGYVSPNELMEFMAKISGYNDRLRQQNADMAAWINAQQEGAA